MDSLLVDLDKVLDDLEAEGELNLTGVFKTVRAQLFKALLA